jgi:hypothetical protein
MICTICKTTVAPRKMHQHIRKPDHNSKEGFVNGKRLDYATHEFCSSIAKDHKLEDPKDCQPKTIIPAIPGLPIYSGLYCCRECGYACKTEMRITGHQRKADHKVGFFQGPAQTYVPSSKRQYFAVTVKNTPAPNPLDPFTLFEQQFSSNPYKDITVQASSHPAEMNIFLSHENWLEEVKGMTRTKISTTATNPLPELQKQVREVVDSWTSTLSSNLESASGSIKLRIGDYNK